MKKNNKWIAATLLIFTSVVSWQMFANVKTHTTKTLKGSGGGFIIVNNQTVPVTLKGYSGQYDTKPLWPQSVGPKTSSNPVEVDIIMGNTANVQYEFQGPHKRMLWCTFTFYSNGHSYSITSDQTDHCKSSQNSAGPGDKVKLQVGVDS